MELWLGSYVTENGDEQLTNFGLQRQGNPKLPSQRAEVFAQVQG